MNLSMITLNRPDLNEKVVYLYQSDGTLLSLWDKETISNQLRMRNFESIPLIFFRVLFVSFSTIRNETENYLDVQFSIKQLMSCLN